jgi:hypothetical protein
MEWNMGERTRHCRDEGPGHGAAAASARATRHGMQARDLRPVNGHGVALQVLRCEGRGCWRKAEVQGVCVAPSAAACRTETRSCWRPQSHLGTAVSTHLARHNQRNSDTRARSGGKPVSGSTSGSFGFRRNVVSPSSTTSLTMSWARKSFVGSATEARACHTFNAAEHSRSVI